MEDLYNSQPQPLSTPPVSTGGGSSKGMMIGMIVMAVLLVGAIGFGVWQWMEVSKKNTEISNLQASNTQLQSQASSLEQQVETEEGTTTAATDTDRILAAVDAYTRAPVSASGKVFKYSVAENNGTFAKVTVEVEGAEGYEVVLKKIDNVWTAVVSTADSPTQADLDAYGVPAGFVTIS